MKNEGDFNFLLSKQLRGIKNLHFVKAADKFTLGISDFLIWYQHKSIALETKLVAVTPSNKAKLLKHPFSGPQYTFLKRIDSAGSLGWGGIFFKETSLFYLVPFDRLELNWTVGDFFERKFVSYKLWEDLEFIVGALCG